MMVETGVTTGEPNWVPFLGDRTTVSKFGIKARQRSVLSEKALSPSAIRILIFLLYMAPPKYPLYSSVSKMVRKLSRRTQNLAGRVSTPLANFRENCPPCYGSLGVQTHLNHKKQHGRISPITVNRLIVKRAHFRG